MNNETNKCTSHQQIAIAFCISCSTALCEHCISSNLHSNGHSLIGINHLRQYLHLKSTTLAKITLTNQIKEFKQNISMYLESITELFAAEKNTFCDELKAMVNSKQIEEKEIIGLIKFNSMEYNAFTKPILSLIECQIKEIMMKQLYCECSKKKHNEIPNMPKQFELIDKYSELCYKYQIALSTDKPNCEQICKLITSQGHSRVY